MLAMETGELRERVATTLLEAFDASGDVRFRIAHGIVTGRRAGRPAVDDGAALEAMRELIASGRARTAQQAARFAARAVLSDISEASTVRRLLSKYKAALKEHDSAVAA
jgi:hypothetical protein